MTDAASLNILTGGNANFAQYMKEKVAAGRLPLVQKVLAEINQKVEASAMNGTKLDYAFVRLDNASYSLLAAVEKDVECALVSAGFTGFKIMINSGGNCYVSRRSLYFVVEFAPVETTE